jgi:hypothetical protein
MGLCGNDPPDASKGYAAGIQADLEALPWKRMIESASATGDKVTIDIPGKGPMTFDFSGLGQADYQSQYGDQMASQLLQLQKDFGPAYVEQRLHELERSDPEGAAMRQKLWDSVRSDVGEAATAHRPAADELQKLILDELNKGGKLDDRTAMAVSQAVRGKQTATGNYLGNAATTEEAGALAGASEQQAAQRQQEALAFLTSGATPEDVAYRREQQALGNLGSFISGETPTAQFGQLSGAGNQIVPFYGGGALTGVNPNAGANGINFANGLYSAQTNWANSQVNPWIAGLSGAARGVQVWAGLGGGGGSAAPSAPAGGSTFYPGVG